MSEHDARMRRLAALRITPRKERQSKGEETRRVLLTAAEKILLEQGLLALSVRNVGATADIAPTLVTYHFGKISNLLEELSDQNLDLMLADWQQLFSDNHSSDDLREILRAWLKPLLRPSAYTPEGRALVVLDEIASHGDQSFRERLMTPMLEVSRVLRDMLGPMLPHLTPAQLRARLRFLAGAALGPPPRARSMDEVEGARALSELDFILDFAVASLKD